MVFGIEREQVDLDERGQWQPLLVGRCQDRLVEREPEAPLADIGQGAHLAVDLFDVVVGHRRNFEHETIGLHQFKMAAGQTGMGAIDEHGPVVDQRAGVGM
jgi:hypothetical protein